MGAWLSRQTEKMLDVDVGEGVTVLCEYDSEFVADQLRMHIVTPELHLTSAFCFQDWLDDNIPIFNGTAMTVRAH
jgi:hypothetical protein